MTRLAFSCVAALLAGAAIACADDAPGPVEQACAAVVTYKDAKNCISVFERAIENMNDAADIALARLPRDNYELFTKLAEEKGREGQCVRLNALVARYEYALYTPIMIKDKDMDGAVAPGDKTLLMEFMQLVALCNQEIINSADSEIPALTATNILEFQKLPDDINRAVGRMKAQP